jgi:hypothetical protein
LRSFLIETLRIRVESLDRVAPDLLRSGEKEIERLTFVEASVLDTKSPSYRKIIHKPSAGGHVLGLQSEDRLMVVIGGII